MAALNLQNQKNDGPQKKQWLENSGLKKTDYRAYDSLILIITTRRYGKRRSWKMNCVHQCFQITT